jgi:hypothetical protein
MRGDKVYDSTHPLFRTSGGAAPRRSDARNRRVRDVKIMVALVAVIAVVLAGCGGGSNEAETATVTTGSAATTETVTGSGNATSPSTASERYAGITRDDAVHQAKATLEFLSGGESIPEPTLVKPVSYYDCQVQRKGACGDQPLLHAWYVHWGQEHIRDCVYINSRGAVIGPSCDLGR